MCCGVAGIKFSMMVKVTQLCSIVGVIVEYFLITAHLQGFTPHFYFKALKLFFSENPSEENQVCYYCRGNKLRQIYLWYLTSQSWMFCSCGLYKEWNSPVSPCCPGAPGLPGKPVGPIRPTSPRGPGVPGGPGGPAGPGLLLCMPLGIWFNIALYRLIWPWRRAITYKHFLAHNGLNGICAQNLLYCYKDYLRKKKSWTQNNTYCWLIVHRLVWQWNASFPERQGHPKRHNVKIPNCIFTKKYIWYQRKRKIRIRTMNKKLNKIHHSLCHPCLPLFHWVPRKMKNILYFIYATTSEHPNPTCP